MFLFSQTLPCLALLGLTLVTLVSPSANFSSADSEVVVPTADVTSSNTSTSDSCACFGVFSCNGKAVPNVNLLKNWTALGRENEALKAEQSRLREELEQLRKNARSRRFYWCTDSKLKDALEELSKKAAYEKAVLERRLDSKTYQYRKAEDYIRSLERDLHWLERKERQMEEMEEEKARKEEKARSTREN
ncbi:hypothetical protein TYRP_009464 [Tyrophagus putrescentiae]|nr:hypothetical protein TYRP_009464 [Tyrophagus putrescentiae]